MARDHDVVTIAMRSGDTATVQRHLAEHAARFPVLNDPQGTHATRWGVHAVPASFVVDARGRIRFVDVGYTTGWGLKARLWWAGWRPG
nr:redoxin domain-containing protein [Methylibium petroleiphilum]